MFSKNGEKEQFLDPVRIYLVLGTLGTVAISLSRGFLILYYFSFLDARQVAIVIAVSYLVATFLDYPTGVLADILGPKWILGISYALFGVYYGGLLFARSFFDFLVLEVVAGVGNAQQSGTLISWFTNAYKARGNTLKSYRRIKGKLDSVLLITNAIFLAIGGILAISITPTGVFGLQVVLCLIFIMISQLLMNKTPQTVKRTSKMNLQLSNYLRTLKEGLQVVRKEKSLLFFIIAFAVGVGIGSGMMMIWQPILRDFGATYAMLGIIAGVGSLLAGSTQFFNDRLSGDRDPLEVSYLYTLIRPLFFANITIILVFGSLHVVSLNFIVLGLLTSSYWVLRVFSGVSSPNMYEFFHSRVPDNHRTSLTSLLNSLMTLASTGIVLALGFFVSNFGYVGGTVFIFSLSLSALFFMQKCKISVLRAWKTLGSDSKSLSLPRKDQVSKNIVLMDKPLS